MCIIMTSGVAIIRIITPGECISEGVNIECYTGTRVSTAYHMNDKSLLMIGQDVKHKHTNTARTTLKFCTKSFAAR